MMGWEINGQIDALEAERDRYRARLDAVRSSAPKAGPRGGKRADWTDTVAALVDTEVRLNREIARLCRAQAMIDAAIDAVPDANLRRLLALRYRNYLRWAEVVRRMPCDGRYVYKMHKQALQLVRVPDELDIL